MKAAGLVLAVSVPLAAYGPDVPVEEVWGVVRRAGRYHVAGSFEELPLARLRESDAVFFANGDVLSGRVLKIDEDVVHFEAKMVEGTVKIPFESLKRLELQRRLPGEDEGDDEIALVEGGRFRVSIERTEGENLLYRTGSSSDSAREVLPLDRIACVALGGEPQVILQEEFAEGTHVAFVKDQGDWVVDQGLFLRIGSTPHEAKAYANVRQWGRMRYCWTLDTTKRRCGGMYILAADQGASAGDAYQIYLEGNGLVVNKVTKRGRFQSFFCQVTSVKPRARFEVEYNCETGQMGIWLDGRRMANLRDRSPIASGKYVVLRAVGNAAFDDVRVECLGGGGAALSEEEKGKDVVLVRNGDRIFGNVKGISEGEVIVMAEGEGGEVKADRRMVSQIVFGGRTSPAAKGAGIVFWNANRLAGKVRSLGDHAVVVENETVGKLTFDVAWVEEIVFEE